MTGAWRLLTQRAAQETLARQALIDAAVADQVFDRLAIAIARALGADGGMVTLLLGDSQYRVGCSGAGRRPDEEEAVLCKAAMRRGAGSPLAVNRITPEVAATHPDAPEVGAFLGQAMVVDGELVGTLAVLQATPRVWTDGDRALLKDLVRWPEAELARIGAAARLEAAEAALSRATRVLDSMAEGVIGIGDDGLIALVNPAAARLLGWEAHELVGRNLHDVAHYQRPDGSAYPSEQCPIERTMRDGRARMRSREALWRRDGSLLPVDMSAGAIIDDGEVTGAIVVFDDISSRLEVERIKDDFVAIVSHELRTPLTSVVGSLRLLDTVRADPERSAQMAGIALRNAERLAQLVDDILDLERSETGRLNLHRTVLDAGAVMTAVAESTSGLAGRNGVAIHVEPAGVEFWGDERRVVQVLTNLVGNAVRFSQPGGSVHLTAEHAATEVRLHVRDRGSGIPEDALERIFDRFWQVDAGPSRARDGSGLGLAIAQSMARAHGGRITVTSELGVGSTFTVRLPVRARDLVVPVDRRGELE